MPLKTVLFLLAFFSSSVAALACPMAGIIAYMAHYMVGPERQWWFEPIRGWGIRCSYTLAAVTAVGIMLNLRKLRQAGPLIRKQEGLILLFLAVVWLSVFYGEPTAEKYSGFDHPAMKLTKLVVFALMLTHVVTTLRNLDVLVWALVIGALVLGVQAYQTPMSHFAKGRLESVGGPDFRDANTLGAYLVALLPLIGMQLLRSRWKGKLLCLAAGAFAANAVVLTRSRGAVLGLLGTLLAAPLLTPREHRRKVLAGLVLTAVGACFIVDRGFIERAMTITRPPEQRDDSVKSRLAIWQASGQMLKDYPQGVGAGNFFQKIGRYVPEFSDRDAHSTFVRCYGELGVHGLIVLVVLALNGLAGLRRSCRLAADLPEPQRLQVQYAGFSLAVGLVAFLACGLTMTLLYVEAMWWLLALPACLARAVENARADTLPLARGPRRSPSRTAKLAMAT